MRRSDLKQLKPKPSWLGLFYIGLSSRELDERSLGAYSGAVVISRAEGSDMRLLKRLTCKHEHFRCVHGEEMWASGNKRRACLECDKYLKGSLPEICWYTQQEHGAG